MEADSLFFIALQSSFFLGLIHGINPCGHSWLVLLPFVSGERDGRTVFILTAAFVGGTGLACLLFGATLGSLSLLIPPALGYWLDTITSVVLLGLGLLMLFRPGLLHHHEHEPGHEHVHGHEHGGQHHHTEVHHFAGTHTVSSRKRLSGPALFSIGFVNMIIPCPTVAIMYGYGLNSGSVLGATTVFLAYALSTGIAVGGVIWLIYRVTTMAGKLRKPWVEPMIMRSAGLVVILFSLYGLYHP